MRGSVLGSALAHVAVLLALLVWRPPTPIIVPGPDVVQVALIDPTTATPAVITPPVPKPERRAPDLEPEKAEGVKLAKPKPKPKKPEPEPRPIEPVPPVPALPFAKVGSAGLSGSVAVDSRDFQFTYYLLLVRNRIAQNWAPPAGLGGQTEAVVYFRINRAGEIAAVRVEAPSGSEFFDRAAQRAVVLSDPLPPLPLGWTGEALGVHFGFQYTGP